MAQLPRGTVTFLFTDIEGSTRLLHELGDDRYAEVLNGQRRLLRDVFGSHGGVEVDTQGDAFFYAFSTAPAALAAARAAQEALAATPVAVRIGVHTGTPVVTNEGYVGEDVHRAARIAAAGHGGQVLVSATTAAFAAMSELGDLGDHRLKDLSAPERIYQLGHAKFPRLKTLYQTNLPIPATPFIGRARELAEVVRLLERDDVRLLTLTGAGGSGKTRLAAQVAGQSSSGYPDGVWWVELAPLRDPALVLPAAERVLHAEETCAEHVRGRRMLLVFDNFEQVVDAGDDVGELLAACPRLDVLVTSREPLHLAAEQQYAVPPFHESDAVDFFLTRARATRRDFEANGEVPQICRRLEGLPLALELAAARVKALSAKQILERLEHRLPLLTRGVRNVPERQRTLEAAIAWSYELLGTDEQRLFQRLSVFAGGCGLEAAERVAEASLDTLESLVDKSLLRYTNERYWMLEAIREFAGDRLEESGEAVDLRNRHARRYLELAEAAGLTLEPRGEQQYEVVGREAYNLRAALAWWLETEPELCLRLAAALDAFWVVTNPAEGMRWYQLLLERVADAPLELRARTYMAYGSAANPAGDDVLAEEMYRRSFEAFTELGDRRGVSVALLRLGVSALYRGDVKRALELAEETLELGREIGYRVVESQALTLAGEVRYLLGEHERGIALLEEGADLAAEIDFPWWRSRTLRKLSDCMLDLGRADDAEAYARESLKLMRPIGDRQMMVFALARLARIAGETGRPDQAGLIWGAIEAEEERSAMGAWAKERERFWEPIRRHAGADFERGRALGRELAFADAIDAALGSASVSRPVP
jgi:predicted ATPase